MFTILLGWSIISICAYHLWLSQINKIAQEWGGICNWIQLWSLKDNPENATIPENVHVAITKTVVMVACFIVWPYMLYWTLSMYSKKYQENMKTFMREDLK